MRLCNSRTMGLLENIFKKKTDVEGKGYQTFTEYTPVFSSYQGKIHEQELTRSAIERFSTAASKLKPEITGSAKPRIARALRTSPNDIMTWPTFMRRLAAVYDSDGTGFIVPAFARDLTTIVGLFPLKCEFAELLEYENEPWIRFTFASGEQMAIELKYVGIITKFQYESDLFGERNCIKQTMNLIHAQNQAQEVAIRNGAKIRFIGAVAGQMREEDLKAKRKRFMEDNFSSDNDGGILVYDTTFSDVRQIEPTSYVISNEEMDRIENNVFNYFGINRKILQNDFDEESWSAWYEGKVEPFAVAVGEALTKMCFTEREQTGGNRISFSANRLQYASNKTKHMIVRDGYDRGIFTLNQCLEILQLPTIGPDGDVRVIRGEYVNADSRLKGSYTDGEGNDPQQGGMDGNGGDDAD